MYFMPKLVPIRWHIVQSKRSKSSSDYVYSVEAYVSVL